MKAAKQTRTGGFTLIELIVVIAILGILAGVGTVAYTGYVKAAQKGVDKQTVGDLMYAAQLADYADPGLFGENGNAIIAVTDAGTTVVSKAYESAIEDSVGDLLAVRLTYTGWNGVPDTSVAQQAMENLSDYFANDYEATYANSVSELWKDVEAYTGTYAANRDDTTQGEMLQKAAAYVAGLGTDTVSKWADGSTVIKYGESDGGEMVAVSAALAMARNYSLAQYVANNSDKYSVSPEGISELKSVEGAGFDFFNWLCKGDSRLGNYFPNEADRTALQAAVQDYTTENEAGKSQAQADAQAFVALMQSVNTASDKHDPTDSNYMDTMKNYVQMAGAALKKGTSGNYVSTDDMNKLLTATSGSNSSILIYATKSNGVLTFGFNPTDADPRVEGGQTEAASCTETHNSLITINSTKLVINIKNDKAETVNTIDICTIDPAYKTCGIQANITSNYIPYEVTVTGESDCITVSNGVITAVKPGTATLHFDNGKKQKDLTVNVH